MVLICPLSVNCLCLPPLNFCEMKRKIRSVIFVFLIILACIGIGLTGPIPLTSSCSRKDSQQFKLELIESEWDDSSKQEEIKP